MPEITILEKSLILSYLHCKQLLKNMEVSVIEMKALKQSDAGKLQFNLDQLTGKARKAFAVLEKNLPDMEALELDLDEMLNEHWSNLN